MLAAYRDLRAAGDAVASVVAAGLLPVAMEIMDELAIEAASPPCGPGYPDVPALLIVELDGERACVDEDVARLAEVIRASGAHRGARDRGPGRAGDDLEGPQERVLGRRLAVAGLPRAGRLRAAHAARRGARGDRADGRRAGLRVANVFHAGDGNLHPLILFDGREPGAVERAEALAGEILDLCVGSAARSPASTASASRSATTCRGCSRRRTSRDAAAPPRVDPLELANRGKMFPGRAPGVRPLAAAACIGRAAGV